MSEVYIPIHLTGQNTDAHPYQPSVERAAEEAGSMLVQNAGNRRVGIFKLVGVVTPIAPAFTYTPNEGD